MPLLGPVNETLDVGNPMVPGVPAPPLSQVGHFRGQPPVNVRRARGGALPLGRLLPGRRLIAAVLLTWGAHWMWVYGPRDLEVQRRDRALVASASVLGQLDRSFRFDPEAETLEKSRAWGGGEVLRYHYEPGGDDQPGLRTLVWTEESEEEARETFRRTALHTVFDWGIGGPDVGLIEMDPDGRWAEESAVYRVQVEGKDVGHSVTLRQGTRVLYVACGGRC